MIEAFSCKLYLFNGLYKNIDFTSLSKMTQIAYALKFVADVGMFLTLSIYAYLILLSNSYMSQQKMAEDVSMHNATAY